MEITNDILDAKLLEILSDVPMTAMEIKRIVESTLGAKGYNTNMVTSTGQDNLYIKIKARLRRWAEKGLYCLNVGDAKYISIENKDNYQTPTPTTRVRKSKGEQMKEQDIIEELEPIEEQEEALEVIEEPKVEAKPETVSQPKVQKQETKKPEPKTQTLKDASEIMNDLITNKDFWLKRANASATKLELQETPNDLTCPRIRAMAIQSTKCFGKEYSAKHEECQVCPLSMWCKDNVRGSNRDSTLQAYLNIASVSSDPTTQVEEPKEKKAPREKKTAAQNQQLQKLLEQVQKEGKFQIDLETDITCSITGDKLKKGDSAFYVNNFGVVSPKCFE